MSIETTIERVATSDLTKYPRNPRNHSAKQIDELVRSITEFGQYRPLVVDEEGVILAGNGLHAALTKMGHEEVEIRRITGLTEEQKVKLVLADNRTSDLSTDNYDVIEELLNSLTDFEVPGYDPEMIRELVSSVETLTEDAASYGTLAPETIEMLRGREDAVDGENQQATIGTPPAPLPASEVASVAPPEPTGPVSQEASEARSAGQVCPSCGRAW